MSHTRARLRRTSRIGIFSTALGLALAGALASPALATGNGNGDLSKPQPLSKADTNPGGANGQCPDGPYCSTRDGSASLNGNGNGKATGKPCAGCVGKADNKNPRGQMPNGSDHNAGYECDRNNGIGKTNPAHTGCKAVTPPNVVPPNVVPPNAVPPNVVPPNVVPPNVVPPKAVPPKAVPPNVVPPNAVPPNVVPPKAVPPNTPPVLTPTVVEAPVVLGTVVEEAPTVVQSTNPLPTAAAAGQADTSGQLLAGGFAALVGFLALGVVSVLRRRRGEA